MTLAGISAKKKNIDWVAVETHYRAGVRTLEDIGNECGCTKGRISQKAKEHGWTRDLKAKVAARAEDKVNAAALNEQLNAKRRKACESQVVEVNSNIRANIRLAHRTEIQRARALFGKMLTELERTTDNKELYEQLGELLDESGPDSNGTWRKDKTNEIYRKVISLAGRIDNAKKLSEMLERLVKLERQAYGIDDEPESNPLDEILKKIAQEKRAKGSVVPFLRTVG